MNSPKMMVELCGLLKNPVVICRQRGPTMRNFVFLLVIAITAPAHAVENKLLVEFGWNHTATFELPARFGLLVNDVTWKGHNTPTEWVDSYPFTVDGGQGAADNFNKAILLSSGDFEVGFSIG